MPVVRGYLSPNSSTSWLLEDLGRIVLLLSPLQNSRKSLLINRKSARLDLLSPQKSLRPIPFTTIRIRNPSASPFGRSPNGKP